MKILIVAPIFYPEKGGGTQYLYRMSQELAKSNEVMVLTAAKSTSGRSMMGKVTVDYVPFTSRFGTDFLPISAIERTIREFKPDIVHASAPSPIIEMAYFVCKLRSIPMVATYHADLDLRRTVSRLYTKVFARLTWRGYARMIVTTEGYRQIMLKRGIRDDRLVRIPVGVDLERFLAAEPVPRGPRKVILFVGIMDTWHWYKRVDILIRAHAKLLSEGKDYELRLVGRGDLIPGLQALAKELGSEHRVHFLGSPEDEEIPAIYRSADLFVLPSPNNVEGFGIVMLEAMASRLPVITSTGCGGAYAIRESEAGLLYEGEDYQDLAAKIETILSNEELAMSMVEKGSVYVLDYDWTKVGASILKEYEKVLGRSARSVEQPSDE